MGNFITSKLESNGQALLARRAATQSEKLQKRLTFFGEELVSTRATYNEAQVGLGEFKENWAKGLTGRDLAGLGAVFLCVGAGLNAGQFFGRKGGPGHCTISSCPYLFRFLLSAPSLTL